MPTLPKELRTKLEKAVLAGRAEAEKGAEAALEALGVADGKKPGHLDKEGERLRRRLRARGRQAGDVRKADDSQEIRHLVQECGYEHWHRMLFARFLIENGLLIEPESKLDVDFDFCEEEGKRLGIDPWEFAARLAEHMLPQVFRQDDPVLHVTLPSEARNKLTAILNDLPDEVFTADDSLGWTYQFWQTKRKKEVNESGVKIGADEISPVTQLFTEDYMVEFLLHNTLGAWWSGKLGPIAANSEEEARAKAALPPRGELPGITWTYLRFIQDSETRHWTPAAGTFPGWPTDAASITFLDPSMGSGHFLVFALPILARLRMEEENHSAKEAIQVVLRDNLFGLELDPRCTQIGAFNLALTAWKHTGYQILPPLHIACCGLAPQAKKSDWLKLAGDDGKLRRGMERLYNLFEQAPVLGSLINPRSGGDLLEATFDELSPLLEEALSGERGDDSSYELAVTAQGIAKAAQILALKFTMVTTNVPYLSNRKQCDELKNFCTSNYREAKNDLAITFFLRLIQACEKGGTLAFVMPQYWLFKSSYSEVRRDTLASLQWPFFAKLGVGAFETISGEVVNVMAGAWNNIPARDHNSIAGLNVMDYSTVSKKAEALRDQPIVILQQGEQRKNALSRIVLGESSETPALDRLAIAPQGTKTGDDDRWRICIWEIAAANGDWIPYQTTVRNLCLYSGRHLYLDWRTGGFGMVRPRVSNLAVAKRGVAISQSGDLPATLYTGERFDSNVAPLIPGDPAVVPALWAYCSSDEYRENVRLIDQSLKVTNVPLIQVPFDLAHWQTIAAKQYPDGLPKPHSDDPTQWLFKGHPKGSNQPLQVAVARLLGYGWPRQTGSSFPDSPALEADGLESFADKDGIACLTSLRGEANASDRLRSLLGAALGTFDERQLITGSGKKGSKSQSLNEWLRDEFFEQHCELFLQRPFIWHIWDGRKDGFHALVNYHRLSGPDGAGRRTLESLTYGYLGDWITRQKKAKDDGEEGADDRHAAALELKIELERILAGEPPYDLFVRWKPLHQQPIGWEPDINDGVRLNARPFLTATLTRGKKGAGLFRSKPNITWDKDRGNEPARSKDFPWFWNWDGKTMDFMGEGKTPDGKRWNDCHYSTSIKQAARESHQSKGDPS